MNLDLLSDKEKILLPTEEEIAFYDKCGWYVSDKVVPMELIDAAIEGAAALYRGETAIEHI